MIDAKMKEYMWKFYREVGIDDSELNHKYKKDEDLMK